MLVHAFVASVRTRPEPAVFPVFDGFDKVFADFVGCRFGVAVFAEDDLAEFFYTQCKPWLSHFKPLR